MKIRLTLLTVSLLLAHQAMAKDVPLSTAHDIANTTTPASESQAFDSLENQSLAALRAALKGTAQRWSVSTWKKRRKVQNRPTPPG
jgi:hypothetical protein